MKKYTTTEGVPITKWDAETWQALNAAIRSGADVQICVGGEQSLPEKDFRSYFKKMAEGTSAPEENKFILTGNILRR